MKTSKKNFNQLKNAVTKREDKMSINTKQNSVRYFQYGLIISLLAVIALMELKIGFTATPEMAGKEFSLKETHDYAFKVEEIKVVKPPIKKNKVKPPKVQKKVITNEIKVIDNNTPDKKDTPVASTDNPVDKKMPPKINPLPTPEKGHKTMLNVEFAPIFPGCENLSGNKQRIDCMSSKVTAFIGKKFRTDKFEYLKEGDLQRIYAQFTIDKSGRILDIKARATDRLLEKEAQRVISQLPLMTPGKQGDVKVDVQYTVPIVFQIDN